MRKTVKLRLSCHWGDYSKQRILCSSSLGTFTEIALLIHLDKDRKIERQVSQY